MVHVVDRSDRRAQQKHQRSGSDTETQRQKDEHSVAVLGLPVWVASWVAMILGRGARESEQLKASSLLI